MNLMNNAKTRHIDFPKDDDIHKQSLQIKQTDNQRPKTYQTTRPKQTEVKKKNFTKSNLKMKKKTFTKSNLKMKKRNLHKIKPQKKLHQTNLNQTSK